MGSTWPRGRRGCKAHGRPTTGIAERYCGAPRTKRRVAAPGGKQQRLRRAASCAKPASTRRREQARRLSNHISPSGGNSKEGSDGHDCPQRQEPQHPLDTAPERGAVKSDKQSETKHQGKSAARKRPLPDQKRPLSHQKRPLSARKRPLSAAPIPEDTYKERAALRHGAAPEEGASRQTHPPKP